jgi:hypothetical protein
MCRESRRLLRARNGLAFAALLLSLSSCSAPEPPPPLPPAPVSGFVPQPPEDNLTLSVEALVGCYHVVRTEWTSAYRPPAEDERPPDSFQLSDAPWPTGREGRYKVLIPGRPPTSAFGWSSWGMAGSNELTISFGGGFGGVELVLHQRARDRRFYGRMQVFSDSGWPLPQGTVLLERVPCQTH